VIEYNQNSNQANTHSAINGSRMDDEVS